MLPRSVADTLFGDANRTCANQPVRECRLISVYAFCFLDIIDGPYVIY